MLCCEIGLFAVGIAAIDGSKFKAVNTRDKNFTATKLTKRIEQVEAHIAGYLQELDTADRQEGEGAAARSVRLKDNTALLRRQMHALRAMEAQVDAAPDGQVSLTDPDARAMATSGRGSGIVGYNVQSAVDAQHHLIVTHDGVTTGSDRQQLSAMAINAKDAMGAEKLEGLADRGYFLGEEILACERAEITPFVPKPFTSSAKADGRFGKQDFVYLPEQDVYRCPAGQHLPRHMTIIEKGLAVHRYWDLASCQACGIKGQCTPSRERRISRWEREAMIDAMQTRLDLAPHSMRSRRKTVEHPFGTIKAWAGSTHLLTKRLKNVRTEISLHVLAYNLKRVIAILGTGPLIAAIRA